MKQVVIIGGGQHAVVVAEIAEEKGYKVLGFLDDNLTAGMQIADYQVLGKVEFCEDIKDAQFVIAIGNNQSRKEISERYRNLKWATLIHPSAVISRRSIIEEGTVVCAHATV